MSNRAWKMPVPYRGQIVLWYESATRDDSRACPALVKVEDHSSVHLHVFGIDRQFDMDCVRHMDDPTAREAERITQGGWDFTAGDRMDSVTLQDELRETAEENA